ncbi:hypothetical protein SAMN05421676_10189 [Salinibacillus kushneri]|uniref:Uncharacterized protein n=1 Tax=Salinibacillus kushneri TaxID=237682 RepID=A0A1H9YBV1_9BACI|nr:hypothetical protein SAMN05421676_10189 [Salinibacillus kushneri]
MQQSHGMGYMEYSRKLDKRLLVEKRREQSYQKSRQVIAEMDRQVFR